MRSVEMDQTYTICVDNTTDRLIKQVNELLRQGWTLVGGISVTSYVQAPDSWGGSVTVIYAQGMMKSES